jgi:hypothetical protein
MAMPSAVVATKEAQVSKRDGTAVPLMFLPPVGHRWIKDAMQ